MQSESSDRRNRARERHQRRKARQQGMAQPLGARVSTRHLTPSGGMKLPTIKLPYIQGANLLLYGAVGVLLIVGVIVVLGRLTGDDTTPSANAIWIGTEWTYDRPPDDAVQTLARRLRDHQIGTVYAWVSLLQPDGTWSETINMDAVQAFAQQFRAAYPEAQLYGWLSIAAQGTDGSNRLGNTSIQQQVADFSQRVTGEFGFDGVLLNVVPVLDGDENYITLLRRVRLAIGDSGVLAVAVPPDWTPPDDSVPQPPQIAPNTIWADDYKRRVALLADEIAITAYNSGLLTADDYAAWVAYQVSTYAGVIASMEAETALLVGVPSYDTPSPEHRPDVETIAAAADGIRRGLQQAGDAAGLVRGAAIYAEWDTDEADWVQFRESWLR